MNSKPEAMRSSKMPLKAKTDLEMNLVLTKDETADVLGEEFAQARKRLPGAGKVAQFRQQAFDAFAAAGLPHRRIEDWKYTDLRALMRKVWPLAPAPDDEALSRAASMVEAHAISGARQLVLVDGVFVQTLSDLGGLENGVRIRSLREVLEGKNALLERLLFAPKDQAVVALNAAMMTDGVVIELAEGASLDRPIHLLHVATSRRPVSIFSRSLVEIGQKARATLVESYVSEEANSYQVNDTLLLSVADDARLDHIRLVEESSDASNISSSFVTLGARAHLNAFGLTAGGAVSRYQTAITCAGEGSRIESSGVNLLKGRQHADTTLLLDHAVPHCSSREVFRAVVDDRAHSVFQGRIIVRPKAQKTDARMMTRALLLSDEAEADNKPELEIFADDVTCGHGATAGALDEQLLFYLRARGLSEREAQALLVQAFVGEAIEEIADEALRDIALASAARWLSRRG